MNRSLSQLLSFCVLCGAAFSCFSQSHLMRSFLSAQLDGFRHFRLLNMALLLLTTVATLCAALTVRQIAAPRRLLLGASLCFVSLMGAVLLPHHLAVFAFTSLCNAFGLTLMMISVFFYFLKGTQQQKNVSVWSVFAFYVGSNCMAVVLESLAGYFKTMSKVLPFEVFCAVLGLLSIVGAFLLTRKMTFPTDDTAATADSPNRIVQPMAAFCLFGLLFSLMLLGESIHYGALHLTSVGSEQLSVKWTVIFVLMSYTVVAAAMTWGRMRPLWLLATSIGLTLLLQLTLIFKVFHITPMTFSLLQICLRNTSFIVVYVWFCQTFRFRHIGGLLTAQAVLSFLAAFCLQNNWMQHLDGFSYVLFLWFMVALAGLLIWQVSGWQDRFYTPRLLDIWTYDVATAGDKHYFATPLYALWGRRLLAFLIDALLIGLINLFLRPFGAVGILLSFFTAIAYFRIMEANSGKTVGKMALGIQVINRAGVVPTGAQVAIRTLCRFIPFYQLSVLFGGEGLHDALSCTLVVTDEAYEFVETTNTPLSAD